MESHEDTESDTVIDNLVNMFGNFLTKQVIASLVEYFGGDLNRAVDAIMELTNSGNMMPKLDIQPTTSKNPNSNTPHKQEQQQQLQQEVNEPLQENCSGLVNQARYTVNQSVDAIKEITNDGTSIPKQENHPSVSQKPNSNTPLRENQPLKSTVRATTSKGAIPKHTQMANTPNHFWTDQIRRIVKLHRDGSRIMIIMRGLPGSGKSHLSRLLVETLIGTTDTNDNNHIFSTDDYFYVKGQYKYDASCIPNAHSWNQERVSKVAWQGLSPIIVDNTNIETWEMRSYAINGVNNGYYIEVVEPSTPWAKNPKALFNSNEHNVPLQKIKRMLDNYVENITGESLMHTFGLKYLSTTVPPIRRTIPPVVTDNEKILTSLMMRISEPSTSTSGSEPSSYTRKNRQSESRIQSFKAPNQSDQNSLVQPENVIRVLRPPKDFKASTENVPGDLKKDQLEFNTVNEIDDLTEAEKTKQKNILAAQKTFDELQIFEDDWENGEKWDEDNKTATTTNFVKSSNEIITNTVITTPITSPKTITTSFVSNLKSKPPREKKVGESCCEPTDNALMQSVNDCQDWRNISLFLPPWDSQEKQPSIAFDQENPVEKISSSTCREMYDTSTEGKHKIITTTPRNINEFYVPPVREKIPDKRMLDKSTMTNDDIKKTFNCPQKERHFIAFRKLFKHIERESLRYIFDTCRGDTNWAVDNILEGEAEYKLKSTEHDIESDSEGELDQGCDQPCTCLIEYEMIPNVSKSDDLQLEPTKEVTEQSIEDSSPRLEKKKRVIFLSEENMQLKKQIEQNVVIPDRHYSEHCLKIRKIRRGEVNTTDHISGQPSTSRTPDKAAVNPKARKIESSDDESGSDSNIGDCDKIVNMNLGSFFIKNLDSMFGRKDMEYPDNMNYNISIPTSLVNEINALWMESIMYQLDENARKSVAMIKEDEDFARQLVLKERELKQAGKEPDVPDFKEIMDLELALNLHMKDISEWRNNIPTDLATKMTHIKLFNLFPEIKQDTLLEMLFAHDNNFKATVEILLISLGHDKLLETENGLNRFIMEKEIQRQEKILAEEKKALLDSQFPPLDKDEKVDMSLIMQFRELADKHLNRRNIHMQKAEEYIRRGMCLVANHYSEIANFHKTQYEQANSKAVASLMQYHAQNNPDGETVDLHYFRVKEAKETLDLFLDSHIQRLKETNKRQVTLFFITGRGLHSAGGPKVKPACIKRLRERGLTYSECNPGLLRSRISSDDKLTYQVT